MARQALYRHLQDIGNDLHPESRIGAAIRRHVSRRCVAHIVENFDMMAEGIAEAFQEGSPDMRRSVIEAQYVRSVVVCPSGTGISFVNKIFLLKTVIICYIIIKTCSHRKLVPDCYF